VKTKLAHQTRKGVHEVYGVCRPEMHGEENEGGGKRVSRDCGQI